MNQENYKKVHSFILDLMKKVYVEPEGLFDYPSLTTTAGRFYSGCMFTWDTHHMTLRYAMNGEPEVMKYFLLNMFKFQRVSGFMSCCVSSKDGATYSSDFHAQPFLAQNAAEYLAALNTNVNDELALRTFCLSINLMLRKKPVK